MEKKELTEQEWKEKEELTRTVLINMKAWSWDVIPQFKIEDKEKDIVIEALERLLTGIQLRGIVKECTR